MAEELFRTLKWDQLWAATQETLYMTALLAWRRLFWGSRSVWRCF